MRSDKETARFVQNCEYQPRGFAAANSKISQRRAIPLMVIRWTKYVLFVDSAKIILTKSVYFLYATKFLRYNLKCATK